MQRVPRVAVVVLNWNGLEDTVECLESVHTMDYPNFEMVVVDNGSVDGSPKAIREAFPRVTLLETGQNLGYAGGNNVGIRHALTDGAEYVLLLNNDAVVDSRLLSYLLRAAAEYPTAGIYQPKIYFSSDPKRIWFGTVRWVPSEGVFIREKEGEIDRDQAEEVQPTAYACGCALFFHADVARRVGLLEPRFFLCWEEVDWCSRAKRAGYHCLMVPQAKVWHKVSASFGGNRSPMFTYFIFRNRLLWIERNLRGWEKLIAYREAMRGGFRSGWKFLKKSITRAKRAHERAVFCGTRDYLLRRFGDCPDWLRSDAKSRNRAGGTPQRWMSNPSWRA